MKRAILLLALGLSLCQIGCSRNGSLRVQGRAASDEKATLLPTPTATPTPTLTPSPTPSTSGGNTTAPPAETVIDWGVYRPIFGESPVAYVQSLLFPVSLNGVNHWLAPSLSNGSLSSDSTRVEKSIYNSLPVVLKIAGFMSASYRGGVVNAGVKVTVAVDGVPCASSLSFEGSSSSIDFTSSASCIEVLPPGSHTIAVYDETAPYYSMFNYRARVQYEMLPVPASGVFSPVIATESVSQDSTAVEKSFTTTFPTVVEIAGWVKGHYQGGIANAGVIGAILVDGELCSATHSFEGSSANITFDASPSCIRKLAPGRHTIRVEDQSAFAYPAMTQHFAKLQYVVLAAPDTSSAPTLVYANAVSANAPQVSTTLVNTAPIVVTLAGYARGHYQGGIANAGVNGAVYVDGNQCAAYLSFEGASANVVFHASAACIVTLSPGSHLLEVRSAEGTYTNGATFSQLQYSAVALP